MNSTLLSVALISSLAMGCGGSAAMNRAKAPTAKAKAAAVVAAAQTADAGGSVDENEPPFSAPASPALAKEAPAKTADAAPAKIVDTTSPRMPGDYIVHKFSGSFRESPITLTQRVNARDGNTLVIDITYEEGDAKQALRVRMDDSPERRGEVLSVAKLEGDREIPTNIEAYEQLMARTAISADENEEVLGSEALTMDVGGASMPCNKTTYRIRIGKHEGTLRTLQSDKFAWGDLGGEITTENGKLIYKAELVDAGHSDASKPAEAPKPAIAHTDEYDE